MAFPKMKRHVPVRVRQYWKLLVACGAFVVALTVAFSTVRVHPYVTSASDQSADDASEDLQGLRDVFDASVAHSIKLTYKPDDYQRMLATFSSAGNKDYLEADLVVDGTAIPSVGIRLKGNSTLRGFGRTSLDSSRAETMPWLIRFDKFVPGRRYQGLREIAVRVAGMNGGSTVMNEAVTLDVLARAGEPAERYSYASFVVNDRPATARLIVETPDKPLAARMAGKGVLYKALSSGQFTDQGDDPVDYEDDFEQITRKGSQDLQPVIDLVRWVSSAGDSSFAADLDEHVDVPSFARYAAAQNLLLNFDDMAGPGKNYYLWYDLGTRKFSVIGWDYNLTFSGNASQDPHETSSRFGGGGPPGRGGGFGQSNPLKQRFLSGKSFTEAYDEAYRSLYRKIFASGQAMTSVDNVVKVLSTVKGSDPDAVAADAEQLRSEIRQRTAYLSTNAVATG